MILDTKITPELANKNSIKNIFSVLITEENVLGCMILNTQLISKAMLTIKHTDFLNSIHQTIYLNIIQIYLKHKIFDVQLLLEKCIKINESIGDKILKIIRNTYIISAFNVHLNKLKEYSFRRQLKQTAKRLMLKSDDYDVDFQCLVQNTKDDISNFLSHDRYNIKNWKQNLSEFIALKQSKQAVKFLSTGFIKLDNILGGMRYGDLITLGARTSVGKTSFAINLAIYNAIYQQKKVVFFSLEMNVTMVMERIMSKLTNINVNVLSNNNCSYDLISMLKRLEAKHANNNFWIIDIANLSVLDITNIVHLLNHKHEIDMIVIDYIGLIKPLSKNKNQPKYLEVSNTCRRLKQLAMSLNIVVISISQLSRSALSFVEPNLNHLKESGGLEEHSDTVLLLYPNVKNVSEFNEEMIKIHRKIIVKIAKNRHGRLGKTTTNFFTNNHIFTEQEPIC